MSDYSLTGLMQLGEDVEKASNEGRLFVLSRRISLDTQQKIIEAIKQIDEYNEVNTDCRSMV